MSATIKRDEIQKHLTAGDSMFLLETLPEQYYKKGHLPGANPISQNAVNFLSPVLQPDKDPFIVVFCASNTRPNSKLNRSRFGNPYLFALLEILTELMARPLILIGGSR
jgi:hypothetical protein